MEIKDMDNNELMRQYAGLLIEIDNKYQVKKEFEKEYKDRLKDGRIK